LPIRQDRSRGDPVKTEDDQDQGVALVGQMRKPLSFAPPLICGWQRKTQRLFLWKRPVNASAKTGRNETSRRANGECQFCRKLGSRGTQFLLAELRGGSPLSGCWGEASGAGRGQGPAQLSVGNRHLVLGITCRQTSLFPWGQEAGATHDFQERSNCL